MTMDPDLVRQQEDAERAAAGLPPKKPINGSAGPIQSRHAPSVEEPATFGLESEPEEKPAAASKSRINPNRRALPPIGSGRLPGEAPRPPRRIRGLLRLFLYALGGAAVGAIAGFVATTYYDVFKDQKEFFIYSMAGGFALLFGLMHLLHYDHS
jgi:hypothetical protein